jgi:hypothetical protein
MYKIQLNDARTATEAIGWCHQLQLRNWNVHPNWPGRGYVFKFDNCKDASWFGLHWAH